MTRDELYAAIDTLWGGNQNAAARDLGISIRTLRAGLTDPANSSYRALNPGVVNEIRDLLTQFPDGITNVDPRKSISILQDAMVRAGWTQRQAAASIYGAARANAISIIGQQDVDNLTE